MIRFLNILFLVTIFQIKILSQGDSQIKLVKFEPSECGADYNVGRIKNRIVSIEKYNDTTVVEIQVSANCCINKIPEIFVSGDTIDLKFDYNKPIYVQENGDTIHVDLEACECNCCFSFKYYITGIKNDNIIYRVNKSIIVKSKYKYIVVQEPTFDLVNGDTINYVDIYGFKQGPHRSESSSKDFIGETYYCDGIICKGLMSREYKLDGTLVSEMYQLDGGKQKVIDYYNDGSIKSICFMRGFLDKTKNCTDYKKGERMVE